MNDLNLNETTLDRFENYAKNRLNASEKAEFNNLLAENASFRSNYQSFLVSTAIINEKIEASLREQMKQWKSGNTSQSSNDGGTVIDLPVRTTPVKKLNWTRYVAAASILILLSIGISQYLDIKSFPGKMIDDQLEFHAYANRSATLNSSIDIEKIVQELLANPTNQTFQKAKSELVTVATEDANYNSAQDLLIKIAVRTNDKTLANQALKNSKAVSEKIVFIDLLFLLQGHAPKSEFTGKLNDYFKNYSNGSYVADVKKIQDKVNSFSWSLFR